MYGLKEKYLKTTLLLLAALAGLSVGYNSLSHAMVVFLFVCTAVLVMLVEFCRNAFTHASYEDSQTATMLPPRRDRKFSAPAHRRRRNPEVLAPETTVSLASERREADIEDV